MRSRAPEQGLDRGSRCRGPFRAAAARVLRGVGRADDLRHPLGVGAGRHRGRRGLFADNAQHSLGKDRIIADPLEVVRRSPDIILGSWCGKKFRPDAVAARPGWERVPAVAQRQLHEIKSPIILQPGPAALTDGVRAIHEVIAKWQERNAVRLKPIVK